MSTCVDVYDLRRGLLKRDEDLISKLFTLDPVITLREEERELRDQLLPRGMRSRACPRRRPHCLQSEGLYTRVARYTGPKFTLPSLA